ncbi:putative flavonol synthase protein [Emericellopsis cladophorae]|uniref:Flavonol synthase protein n=1 Tax=Emericellopsis cladophorae TaxID=2686198 RepID=A0A9P9XZ37_9HYPO|nr:putative flavonol synthase protein [Emericellopsis cladophorae]KAI6780549.1 putative flavonol synthase protein [Emericellopsis cladophorae]
MTVSAANDGRITQSLPKLLYSNKAEIEDFAKSLLDRVLDCLNRPIALALELPEDFFVNMHRWIPTTSPNSAT